MESKYNLANLSIAASELIEHIHSYKVIAFNGNMGAGKTTLIKEMCTQLGVTDTISSPTYSIINQYNTQDGSTIYHIDLYRIKDVEEAINAGVEECLYSGNLCFVEWPERAGNLFPLDTVEVYLQTLGEEERKISVKLPEIKI